MRVFSILLSVVLAASAYGQDNSLLSKYRTMALEHEQNVQASKSQLEATELREKSAKSDYFPKLDVNGNYNQIGRTVAVEGQPGYNNFYAVNAVLSQPIYQGGMIRNTYKASQIQTGIAADNVNFVSQNLVLGLDQFYYNAVSRREVAYITEVYKQNIDTLVGVISNRVDQEVVSSNDLYMAQVKLNDAEFQLMQAQKEQRISLMELNRQIGVPVNDATEVEDSLSADMIVLNMDEQLQTAMTSRPEVSAQEKNVSLSEQNKKIITGKYNPQLSVNVGGFYGTDFPYLTDKSVGDYTLQANVKIPIFYWGKRRYEGNASDLNI